MGDNKKSILITGCSSGIGYDCAHGLKARGYRVFATCRREEDAARLRGEGLESWFLDYDDAASIEAALDETLERTGGTLDALFNNGAFGIPGLAQDLPTDALRSIFETNFFGYHDLTRRVIPIMQNQGHGRILMNSSILGFIALKWRVAYNSTKYALEGYSDTLRLELAAAGIDVVLIEPGPITSDIRTKSVPHYEKWIDAENSNRAKHYKEVLEPRLYAKPKVQTFELPASAVTEVVHKALTARRPKARYRVTLPTKVMAVVKRLLPTRIMDALLQRL